MSLDTEQKAVEPVFKVDLEAIEAASKAVADKSRDLKSAVSDLQQLALLPEAEFEEAVTLPVEQIRKVYSGTTGRNIEERRLQVIKMLGLHISVKDICDILRMNHRTVAAIAAQEGQKIAGFSEAFAQTLAGSAMADIALAETKKHDASFKDLVGAANVKLTHAANIKMIGAAAADESVGMIEAVEESEALVKARKFLEAKQGMNHSGAESGGLEQKVKR